jgi:hypothetical protein
MGLRGSWYDQRAEIVAWAISLGFEMRIASRIGALTLLSLTLLAPACRHPHASGPPRQEAYVWQRSWSPAVRQAIQQASGISGFVVLAAEVDLRQGSPRVARIPLDPSLKDSGKPIGAALRVTTFPSRFADEPRIVQLLAGITRDLIAEARAKGIALSEIQIDYDCPESKLDDYDGLLLLLRKAAAPVPVTFTALPSWMGQRRAFGKLIAAADGYVLQIHSLKPPSGPGGELTLLKREGAREWIDTAARFGRPFRVALPTYGYLAAFDAQGRLLGLSAEGPLLSWPEGISVRIARSDPAVLAGLIRDWTRDRPRELTGVLWYRLPVEGDRLNWSWPALRAVMAGRVPHGAVRAVVRAPEPGLAEIDLVNEGDGESALPSPVRVRWKDGTFLAADGLAGYQMRPPERNELSLARPRPGRLRPGERRTVAWLRFVSPTEIQVELPRQAG